MGKVGLRTVMELRGIAVHQLDDEPADKQTTCCSRSFGDTVSNIDDLHDAVVTFAARAAEKIRKAGLVAGALQVFAYTDRFRPDQPQATLSSMARFQHPTSDAREVIGAAVSGLRRAWKDGYAWKKAGVLLVDLVRPEDVPRDLFAPAPQESAKPKALMRLAVERRLSAELDAMEAPFGFAYVSPDGLELGGSGEEQRSAYWDLKFDPKYRGWRLMVATKRLILALDQRKRYFETPELAHKIVNGLVDLAGEKAARGPKRKFSTVPKMEWGYNRIEAWQAVRIDGKSLRTVAKEYGVGVATLHRAITTLDPYADMLQPGALPMPGSDEDKDLGMPLMALQQSAHALRKAGLTANHVQAYPLLTRLVVGEVDKLDREDVYREIIKAWRDGFLSASQAANAVWCESEEQLGNLASNLGVGVEEEVAQ